MKQALSVKVDSSMQTQLAMQSSILVGSISRINPDVSVRRGRKKKKKPFIAGFSPACLSFLEDEDQRYSSTF
jgi:hypothetical protein